MRQHYTSYRLSFSLRTKSNAGALRAAQSVTKRLEDYWLGLRVQNMDIPSIHLVKANHVDDSSLMMLEAVENQTMFAFSLLVTTAQQTQFQASLSE